MERKRGGVGAGTTVLPCMLLLVFSMFVDTVASSSRPFGPRVVSGHGARHGIAVIVQEKTGYDVERSSHRDMIMPKLVGHLGLPLKRSSAQRKLIGVFWHEVPAPPAKGPIFTPP